MKIDHFTDERIGQIYDGTPLTSEERAFLIEDTANFEECDKETAEQLPWLSDIDLMRRCYRVWADYCACL